MERPLKKAGKRVVVLEARARVGDRVLSIQLPVGTVIEAPVSPVAYATPGALTPSAPRERWRGGLWAGS
ncbi:FAD-dependent oxidoreductase [Streptomyces olivochromogenes]|uniref:FAD-dependent oxidoreductase n=1 Tax=Streptomyces olivochromogenes TaxID=1963 RepID=UPI001F17A0FB|nr:FAD-dependent oxidoreductase [Streptomyces olivochromogenes]MCF3135057.1 FAD-dependent oxidoreductase [Streptomyces olivochromogenes]